MFRGGVSLFSMIWDNLLETFGVWIIADCGGI